MAKVTKKVVTDVTVTLELSMQEATVLRATLGRVQGSNETTARGMTSDLYWSMCDAGVPYVGDALFADTITAKELPKDSPFLVAQA